MDKQQFLNQDVYQDQDRFNTDMHDDMDYPSRLYSVDQQIDYDQMRKVQPWLSRYKLWSWDPRRRTYMFARPPGEDSRYPDYVYCENSHKLVNNSVSKNIRWESEPCVYEKQIVTADNTLTPARLRKLKDMLSVNRIEAFDLSDPHNPFGQRSPFMADAANILCILVTLALLLYLIHRSQ